MKTSHKILLTALILFLIAVITIIIDIIRGEIPLLASAIIEISLILSLFTFLYGLYRNIKEKQLETKKKK